MQNIKILECYYLNERHVTHILLLFIFLQNSMGIIIQRIDEGNPSIFYKMNWLKGIIVKVELDNFK